MELLPAIEAVAGPCPDEGEANRMRLYLVRHLEKGTGPAPIKAALADWSDHFSACSWSAIRNNLASRIAGKPGPLHGQASTAKAKPGQEWREERRAVPTAEEARAQSAKMLSKPDEPPMTDAEMAEMEARAKAEAAAEFEKRKNAAGPTQIRVTPNAKITPTIGETSGGFKSIADIAKIPTQTPADGQEEPEPIPKPTPPKKTKPNAS
jgi:hypothetical protein